MRTMLLIDTGEVISLPVDESKADTLAVDLVRCRECKYASEDEGTEKQVWCNGWGWPARLAKPGDYCSKGARK